LFLPGLLLGAASAFGVGHAPNAAAAADNILIGLELTVLVAWFSLTVLAWRVRRTGALNPLESVIGSTAPSSYFYGGLAAHGLAFIVSRAVPMGSYFFTARIVGVLLGTTMVAAGLYAASRVPSGKIGIRLAGTLHALADTVKMIFKEDFIPPNADKLLHSLAPLISVFPALVVMAVVPFGDGLCFADVGKRGEFEFADLGALVPQMARDGICEGHFVPLQIADLNVGILYLFAISSTGVIGAAIAGWASDNKFSLLGGLRAASQMVSYEVAMGLSLMGLLLIYGTVRMNPMVEWQNAHAWGVFVQPFGFLMFLAASMAETKRVPFDQPEGESEIVAGYFVEYSGFKWGMFMAGEYVEVITSSAILCTLFFGGYAMPFLYADGLNVQIGDTLLLAYKMNHLAVSVIQMLAFFGKTIFIVFIVIFFRWTLPRFRYDQLMKFGWTKLLPFAIANLTVTAIVVVALDGASANVGKALQTLGDLTQALVAVGMFAFPIYVVSLLLRPTKHGQFLQSTSARLAAAAGGTKPAPMQA
jgi:NADH-quinone oxidoreductase subunit H